MGKKAMTMSLNVVVAILVLLVVAMILIVLVNTNVLRFSASSGESIESSSDGVQCQVEIAAYCSMHDSGDTCGECPSCTSAPTCP